jgi:hypothetical protein
MNGRTVRRLDHKDHYGPGASKNIRGILRQELLSNFGFEHMFLMADVLIDRFLKIIHDAEVIHGPLEPFQTVVYGYDKLKKFTYARQPYRLHLRGARVSIITAEEIAQLRAGVSLPQLRSEIAVRILREAYAQNVILSFTDVGLIMCQSPARISQLVRQYRKNHPGEFVPHCGSVLDMGGTLTHKRDAILLYLQGNLTSEIARKIEHAPEDVDRYVYDYQRVIELAQEGKSSAQIAFVTGLRPHVVRDHTALYKELERLGTLESAQPTAEDGLDHPRGRQDATN